MKKKNKRIDLWFECITLTDDDLCSTKHTVGLKARITDALMPTPLHVWPNDEPLCNTQHVLIRLNDTRHVIISFWL